MKKVAFISILFLLLTSTAVWACWNCYGHRPGNSYSQTKSYIEIENKYSERLNELENALESKQLEIYKLLDNPETRVGQVTAKEKELAAIESEYRQLTDEMRQELADKGVTFRHDRQHPMCQHGPHTGHDHQAHNMGGYGPSGCWH